MPASVRKAALVLDLFSVERPHWGPTEVAAELGIAKFTAHALLRELTSVGLTERSSPQPRARRANQRRQPWAGQGQLRAVRPLQSRPHSRSDAHDRARFPAQRWGLGHRRAHPRPVTGPRAGSKGG